MRPLPPLCDRLRAYLSQTKGLATPITYQDVAEALQLSPPHTIRQVTAALEQLIEQDAATGAPLIAALVVSKTRGGLPAPGFFDCAQNFGRLAPDPSPQDAAAFYAAEYVAARAYWRT